AKIAECIGERDFETVFPCAEMFRHREPIAAKHVFCPPDDSAVERNRRQSIESFEDEIDLGVCHHSGINFKARAVMPIDALNPLQRFLVLSIKRIRDQAMPAK